MSKSFFNFWRFNKTYKGTHARKTLQGISLFGTVTVVSNIKRPVVHSSAPAWHFGTNLNWIKCPVCGHGFNQNGNLRRHQQKLNHFDTKNVRNAIRVKIVSSIESSTS